MWPFSRSARTMPLALEMPMPSEPLLITMPGTPTSGWPGKPAQAAKPVQLVERKPAERDQHRVEAGRVVALGGEIEVVVLELR